MEEPVKITELPHEILENILSYLTYDEIAKSREVSRRFNTTCGELLNRGFLNMERRHSAILKKVKSLLPRRESERRVHNLARHSDILTAIETRISMLRMTFMKYIDVNACYFIPGKVIDEILRILCLVENTCTPPRTHEVLQELRDISSMAMEHFDEKIAPNLKIQRNPVVYPAVPGPSIFSPQLPSLLVKDTTFRNELKMIQHRSFIQKQEISHLKNVVAKLITRVKKQNNIIRSQTSVIREQSSKLKDQDTGIAELKRHVEEWDLKFADLVAELSRARDESSSTSTSAPSSSSTPSAPCPNIEVPSLSTSPRLYKSNIKPRMAQIMPRNSTGLDTPTYDYERKRKLPTSSSLVPIKMSRLHYLTDKDDTDDVNTDDIILSSRIPCFLSSSLESILKSPITSIKSRKRKIQESSYQSK